MVVVARVRLHGGRDGVRAHEARHVVDVAVRVVAGDARAEPQHPLDPQPLPQRLLQRRPRQARIPRLPAAEQALLGRQQQALPVPVDGAALQDHAPRPAGRRDRDLEPAHAQAPGDRARQRVVAPPGAVAGPAVEPPVGRRDFAAAVLPAHDEDRAAVPDPGAVRGNDVPVDPAQVDAGLPQPPLRPPPHGLVVVDDRDAFPARQMPHHLGVAPFDGRGLDFPVGAGVRPDEPGRLVRLPLGGHPEALAGRRRQPAAHRAGGSLRGGASR